MGGSAGHFIIAYKFKYSNLYHNFNFHAGTNIHTLGKLEHNLNGYLISKVIFVNVKGDGNGGSY